MRNDTRAQKIRDLLVISGPGDTVMVIGCDACGGVGPKELDAVNVPAYITGRFTSRVALMEVLASGAAPVALVSNLCCEPDPTGIEITRGLTDELTESGLLDDVAITGSSEKNIPCSQTALGVTVIGLARRGDLRFGRSSKGDEIVCIGFPKVGSEVRLGDPDIADVTLLKRVLELEGVHEVVPCGSRGVLHEVSEIAAATGLEVQLCEQACIDVRKTAGPGTCLVASVESSLSSRLDALLRKPVVQVGWLR